MKLSPTLTTVTPLSKFLALFFFILFNVLGFYLGRFYTRNEANRMMIQNQQAEIIIEAQDSDDMSDWKMYSSPELGFTFNYPVDWGEPIVDQLSTRTEVGFINKLSILRGNYYNQDLQRLYSLEEYINNISQATPTSSETFSIEDWVGIKRIFVIQPSIDTESSKEIQIVVANPKDKKDLLTISYSYNSKSEQLKYDQILSTFRFLDNEQVQGAQS